MRTVALLTLLLALAAVGCGGDDEPVTTTTTPTASAPDATAPPPDATQPGTTAVTPPATETSPPADEGDEPPDEQAVRVPASFVVTAGGRLDPPQITVPPFLAVEISVRSDDGRPHRLELQTTPPYTLDVAAGQRTAIRITGLRAGTYPVLLDGREAGALVAGGEVGP